MPNRATPATLVGGLFLVLSAILVAVGITFSAADPELTTRPSWSTTRGTPRSPAPTRCRTPPLLAAGDHFRSRYTVIKAGADRHPTRRRREDRSVRDASRDQRRLRRGSVEAAAIQDLGAAAGAALLAILTTVVLRPSSRDRKLRA